jgi:hypothetical protein
MGCEWVLRTRSVRVASGIGVVKPTLEGSAVERNARVYGI